MQPTDLLYVADAMTGQDAIKSAGEFNRRMGVTGVVLTKMDGDARGGAALSVVSASSACRSRSSAAASGSQDLEPFHPDRVVSRVLGMGDVLSLIEKAEAGRLDRGRARSSSRRSGETSSRSRTSAISCGRSRRWGRSSRFSGCCPAWAASRSSAASREQVDEKQLGRIEAIINSMTPKERRNHQLINGSRRKRIAKGSGTTVEEVNRLLKQFVQMKKMLKQLGGMAGMGKKRGGLGMMKSLQVVQYQLSASAGSADSDS